MSKIIKMVLFVLCAITLPAYSQAPTKDIPPVPSCVSADVREMATCYAELYGADIKVVNLVLNDESKFTCVPKGHNDGGRAFGPAQFHKPTFERHAKLMGEKLDYYSCSDQVKLFTWVFANRTKEKCEWTLYKKIYCKK
jgi:hypothetical protein